jgi:uncharacterized membrane protein
MSDLLAVTFDGTDDAEAALRAIRTLEREGKIQLEDTAVVRKDTDGKVTIHNELASGTEAGIAIGALLGSLLFVMFPVSVVVGAAIGGLVGRTVAPGVDDKFVKEVAADLPPGGSALFLQIRRSDVELVVGALGQFHGRVRQTSLPDEIERALDGTSV